jgi:hypothetical protein
MNPLRIVVAILSLVGAIGTFLPWVSVPLVGTFDGTAGDGPGWITAALFVIAGVVAQATGPKRPLSSIVAAACGAPALLAAGYALYQMLDLQRSATKLAGDNVLLQAFVSSASVEVGLVLVLCAGLAVPLAAGVGAWLGRRRRDDS